MMSMSIAQIEDRVKRMLPLSAPPSEQGSLEALRELVHRAAGSERPVCLSVEGDDASLKLPREVSSLLERVLDVMACGDSVSVVSVPKELTTQQAADMLNVSRQYLVRLLDEGLIPFRRLGSHRRIGVEDVLAYKRDRDAKRRQALRDLTHLTEEMGGYEAELQEP